MDDKILIANVLKKAENTYSKDIINNTFFLDARQLKIVEAELKKKKYEYHVIKLNDDIEKVIIIFLPSYLSIEDIDINNYISCIRINIKKGQVLKHRDYMGAIYNSGIKKECIGDIFVYDDYSACVFCLPNIAEYLKYNLFKIGKYDVIVDIINVNEIELPRHLYEIIKISIPSNRLDNIASEVSKISRNKIVDKITQKEVFVNCELAKDKSLLLNENDIFSIRGVGKFKVSKFIGSSKKGALIYEIKKYV